MKHDDRMRYKKIGERGNEKLLKRTVAIAGLGSTGSAIATLLAREDIDLRLIDMGRIEESDMHRLRMFQEEDITKFKVKQAKVRLASINPKVQVKSFHEEIVASNVFLLEGDVIVDATNDDNINALTINHAVKKKLSIVLVRSSGSKTNVLALAKPTSAKIVDKLKLPSLQKEGIFSPATSMGAAISVAEIIKLLLGEKQNTLISYDAWEQKLKVTKI